MTALFEEPDLQNEHSRGHFPILSRDPSLQKTIRTPGGTAVVEKNDV